MLLLKVQKRYWNINPEVLSSSTCAKCAICGSKKSRFVKNQEVKGLLSKLGIKTPSGKVPILGDILF